MIDEGATYVDQDDRMVVVVDRVGSGGVIRLNDGSTLPGEFLYGGRVYPIKPKFSLRASVAKHVFERSQATWLHTAEGDFVNRLAIDPTDPANEDPGAQDLIRELGPEVTDCTPIDVDLDAVEHWDVGAVDPTRRETIQQRVRRFRVSPKAGRALETAGGRATVGKG